MPRARDALFVAAALLAVGGVSLPSGRAQDAPSHAAAFRRAEMHERSLGDLERAKDLYLEAARAAIDRADRCRAEIRAASCLRRLGLDVAARRLLGQWAPDDAGLSPALRLALRAELAAAQGGSPESAPPPEADAGASPERVARLERELDETRLMMERFMTQAVGARKEVGDLAEALRAKDREIERLRAAQPPPEPTTAEAALELRQKELERQRRTARMLSQTWTQHARLLHQDGRFAEAREALYDALEKDPDNAEAKALLSRVSAPLGDRERLYQRVKEVLALAREVRIQRRTAELEYLVQRGRRLLEAGDLAGSAIPLARARALLAAGDVLVRDPRSARDDVERMIRTAQAEGVIVPADAPSAEPDRLEDRWLEALKGLLRSAGGEVSVGLTLRFHDLEGVLAPALAALPPVPVGDASAGWTLAAERAEPAPLLAAWLRAGESRALAAQGSSLELVGSTVVALVDPETHARLADSVASLSLGGTPGAELEISVVRAPPGDWDALLATRRLESRILPSGGRATVVPARDLAALLDGLGDAGGDTLARGAFRAAHLRPFSLVRGSPEAALTVDVLPVATRHGGAAARVRVVRVPSGRVDGARLEQTVLGAAVLAPGAALVLHGLADPEDPERELVAIVRAGKAASEPPPPPPALDRAPSGPDTRPVPGPRMRVAEHLLPRSLARLYEVGLPALPTPDHPVPGRREALLARLEGGAHGAEFVDLRDDRVQLVGSDAAHAFVDALLAQVAATPGVQRFEVVLHELPPDSDRSLLRVAARLADAGKRGFLSAVVTDPAERRALEQLLAGRGRRLDLGAPVVSAPPTGRADAARVVRTPYRRELDTAPSDELSWGRAETGWAEEGLLLAVRPFGRTTTGKVDLDVSVRVRWMEDPGATTRRTPLGTVALRAPRMETLSGDLSLQMGASDLLVVAGIDSPFTRDGSRLVLLLRPLN